MLWIQAQTFWRYLNRPALAVGMLPLTGTSDAQHMKQDLVSHDLALSADEVQTVESLAG
jgi:hypothetical protein